MTVNEFRSLVSGLADKVYHFYAAQLPPSGTYIIWAETAAVRGVNGDDRPDKLTLRGELDYFTAAECDHHADEILAALWDARISAYISSISYDDQIGRYIYYISWEAVADAGGIYDQ